MMTGMDRAALEALAGRTEVEVTLSAGGKVVLLTPSAFDRAQVEAVFAAHADLLDTPEEESTTETFIAQANAMRLIFAEALHYALCVDGEPMYESADELRKHLSLDMLTELGEAAWDLYGLGKEQQDEALGNSEGSPVSVSLSV